MANNHNFRYLRANMVATLCMAVGTIGDTLEYPHMIYCSCVPSFFFIKGQIHVLYDEKDGVVGFGIGIQFSGEYTTTEQLITTPFRSNESTLLSLKLLNSFILISSLKILNSV